MTTKDAKHEDQGIRIVGQDRQEITEVRQWNRLLRHLLQPIDLHDPVRDPVQVEIAADDGLLCVWAAEGEVLAQFPHDAPHEARQYLSKLSNQSNCQLWLRSRNARGTIVHTYALQVECLRHGERDHNLARETTLDAVVDALRRCTPIHEEDVERIAEVLWESLDPIVTRAYDEDPRQTMAEIQRDLRVQSEGIRHRAAQFATAAARAEHLGLDEIIAKMQARYDAAVKSEPNANTFEAHMDRSLRIDEDVGRENGPTVPRAYDRSGLSAAAVTAAARNIGLDLTCGACASVYFTGIRDAGEHTSACASIPALRARIDGRATATNDHPRPER
jgi:hypothetical protein